MVTAIPGVSSARLREWTAMSSGVCTRVRSAGGLLPYCVNHPQVRAEADPAAIIVTVVVAAGSLIGPGVGAVAGDAWHPARPNALIVGDTAIGRAPFRLASL
jgi:hypothetical protein